jgi:ABC-type sugar transport system permease subunit
LPIAQLFCGQAAGNIEKWRVLPLRTKPEIMSKSIKYGLFTALSLIVYFLIMKLIGQETNLFLRFFNFVIIMSGVYFLFKNEFQNESDNKPSYFEGLASGVVLTVSAVVVFIAFLAIYTTVIDPTFIAVLEDSKIWGNQLTLTEASFAILVEGVASGVIISFGFMQYFKKQSLKGNPA